MNTDVVIQGDALEVLPQLPAGHFHCCVTSPPYFSLRSYLPKGHPLKPLELGSEKSPQEYIENMVAVFREIRRVMHPTGLLFLNMGDSYCNAKGKAKNPGGRVGPGGCLHSVHRDAAAVPLDRPNISDARAWGYAGSDLMNIPHRLAEALRADGWRAWEDEEGYWCHSCPECNRGGRQ